jgi:23S rRNA (pseudouridine1915-N3)-methyltransferase
MRITLLAIGRARGEMAELVADYAKRIAPPFSLTIREFEPKPATSEKECATLLSALPDGAKLVACDERGKIVSSAQFASKIGTFQDMGVRDLAFVIGGADGLTEQMRNRADFILSLGQMTWPHQLARVMLVEQIYRAQQILAGHPYHRA